MGVSAGFSLFGASGVGVEAASDVGTTMDTWAWLDDSTLELDGAGGGGGGERTLLFEADAVDEPSGSVVGRSSNVEVRVLVVSASLVLTSEEEASAEVSELPRNSDSMNDGKSI
jgi:hypothetical protein